MKINRDMLQASVAMVTDPHQRESNTILVHNGRAYVPVQGFTTDGKPIRPIYVSGERYVPRSEVQKWRNDAFAAAAEIARRYGSDDAARDILALVKP